jgi:hypothetical protein
MYYIHGIITLHARNLNFYFALLPSIRGKLILLFQQCLRIKGKMCEVSLGSLLIRVLRSTYPSLSKVFRIEQSQMRR